MPTQRSVHTGRDTNHKVILTQTQVTTSGRNEVAQVVEGSSSSLITVSLEPRVHDKIYREDCGQATCVYPYFFQYTIARAPTRGVTVKKEIVTKCVFFRFLGLHILDSVRPGGSKWGLLRDLLEWIENSAETWFHHVLCSFAPNSKFVNYIFTAVTVALWSLVQPSLLSAWLESLSEPSSRAEA